MDPCVASGRWVRDGLGSKVGVDVVERDARSNHHHLHVIQELADLLRRALLALVLSGHPHLGSLLDDLLADLMNPGVQRDNGARPRWARGSLAGQLGIQLLEGLHEGQGYRARTVRCSMRLSAACSGVSARTRWTSMPGRWTASASISPG